MEHYELEDAFGRRLRPSLNLELELLPRQGGDPHDDLHFYLSNEGRGLARHSGFVCSLKNARLDGVDGRSLAQVTAGGARLNAVQFYDAQSVIHSNGLYSAPGYAIITRDDRFQPLALDVTWYAEDMVVRRASLQIEPGQKIKVLSRPRSPCELGLG